ncbi:MAG: CHASE2 domain-containing protein [Acidobacteria bacterium]|nr:CHASE2 domain-containing protein [Acidobacteriota bacterium]
MAFPRIAPATLGVAAAAWLAVALLTAGGPAARVELPVRDSILRRLPSRPASAVVAVAIDDESLRQLGPWPWERTRLADLVGRIGHAGPRAVAIDILLADPRPGDEALAGALAAAPAVLAATPGSAQDTWVLPAPALAGNAALAHATFELDHDGVMRRLITTKQAGGRALPAFALAAVERAGTARALAVGQALRPSFRVPVAAVQTVSAARVLAGHDLERLRGKIVVVGVTALGLGDRVVTPTSRRSVADPGALVHAATTECILGGELLRQASPAVSALLAALLAVLALQLRRLGGRRHVAAVSLLVVAPPLLASSSLALLRWELPLVTLTAVTVATILLVELRLFLSMDAGTGKAARLLAADLGEAGSPTAASPGARLASLEGLATALARRRADDLEAQRMVAHELKTPLTSVRGLTQLLAGFDLSPEEARRVARMAAAEAERLQGMVDGLLELERLAVRSFAATTVLLDLGRLVGEHVGVLAAGSDRQVDCEAEPGLAVRGDSALLARVLDNLVGNAFKFSPPDSPVRVRVERHGDSAVINVGDDGPGIPSAERERIFQRFVRSAGGASVPGLGLGLALVAEVVTWHGGSVVVDSVEGVGSTFRVVLPFAGTGRTPEA